MTEQILIVGAGHGGVGVAAGLRSAGWTGRVTLADSDPEVPYERPPLSKDFLADPDVGPTPLRRDTYYANRDIERVHTTVVRLDRENKEAHLADGSVIPYTKLVLATGSTPRRLTAPGAKLDGIHYLKTLQDSRNLAGVLNPGRRVVIVGAGYIGLEVAATAIKRGCDVTVLEFQDRVMNRVTGEEVSHHFQTLHRSRGVRFVFGAAVTRFEGSGRVEHVVTADDAIFDADVVVIGVGVMPNQQLAEDAGIAVSDGILVDSHGLTSDPNIYAVGDVTRSSSSFDGTSIRLECIQNARDQAAAVVAAIAGTEPPSSATPWFWTVQHGIRLQTAGVRQPSDDAIVRGDPRNGKFSVVYLREGRVSAIDTVGSLADFNAGKRLVTERAMVAPSLLSDPTIPLSQSVSAASRATPVATL